MMESWSRMELSDGKHHIVPIFDPNMHETDDCWCMPEEKVFDDGTHLVVHYDSSDENEKGN